MNSKQKTTIHNALPIVAAAYGEKFGVKVEIAGEQAHTDGKTIVVPNVPDTYDMNVLWGYLAHEAAHVRFTDFGVRRLPGMHAYLSNVFEDCRIERAMAAQYPGTVMTLNAVASYMAQQGHYQHATESDHPAQILGSYCLYWLQSQAVGQSCLTPFMESAKKVLNGKFPVGAVLRLNVLLRHAVAAQSTQQVCDLASQVMQMIAEEAEKEDQQSQDQQDESDSASPPQGDGGEGDQADESGESEPAGKSSQPPGQDGTDGQDGADGQDGLVSPGNQPQQADDTGTDQADQASSSSHASRGVDDCCGAEVLQQVLSAGDDVVGGDAKDALKAELFAAAKEGGNPDFKTVRTGEQAVCDSHAGEILLSEVKGATSKIRAQLAGMVQASLRSSTVTKRSGKRLDASKLHRAAVGDSRLFLRSAEKKRPNTAIHLLVDMSGSMYASIPGKGELRCHQIARKAALALAVALDSIPNVNPGVSFFGGDDHDPVRIAVKHGESVQVNAGRFGVLPDGGTPMAEAIWYSAFALSKTREDRKMLIVITDGDPNNKEATKKSIELCERSGVEVVGIGVGTSSVRDLFDKSIVINDFMQLQGTLFKLMESSLVAA